MDAALWEAGPRVSATVTSAGPRPGDSDPGRPRRRVRSGLGEEEEVEAERLM